MDHVGSEFASRDHYGNRSVTRYVAVVQSERCRDHAGIEIVIHRKGLPIHGGRIEAGVGASIHCDASKHFPACAELMEVPVRQHPDPIGGRGSAEWHPPRGISPNSALT